MKRFHVLFVLLSLRFFVSRISKHIFFTGLLFLPCFLCFCDDTGKQFFTKSYIEKSINNQSLLKEAIVSNTLLFDRIELEGLNIYHGKMFPNTSIHEYYIDFITHNILLITEKVDDIAYVRDCLIIKKQNPEARLANGPVEINESYFDWDATVLVNHKWRAKFTDDISQAFTVDIQARKIMPLVYDTIRLYSEI
jgi:hypothetical protein